MPLRDLVGKGAQFLSRFSGRDGDAQAPLSSSEQYVQIRSPPNGEQIPSTVERLGTQELSHGFEQIGRDGGAGGYVNGHHIILFSDTFVKGVGPLTCTIAYSDHHNPRKLQDFGGGGCPNQGIPYIQEETDYNKQGNNKTRVVIWPQSAIVNIPGESKKAFAIAPVSIQSSQEVEQEQPSRELYSSIYTITAHHDGPHVERTVPKLWHAGEVLYGTFTTCLGRDNKLYFVATEGDFNTGNCGLKLARADWNTYLDKTKWEFWTGDTWVSTPPKPHEAKPIIDGMYSSGDIFFSPYFGTYLAVFHNKFADSTIRYKYALPDAEGNVGLTGKWSDEFELHDTKDQICGGYGYNFAGHAYPHYDPSGKTLVLTTSLSDAQTPYFYRATFNRD